MQQLSTDNDNLRKDLEKAVAEREAFVSENQAMMELLMKHGIHQHSKETVALRLSVEKLVSEREQQKVTVDKLQTKNTHLIREKESLTQEKQRVLADNRACREAVKGLETEVEDLKKLLNYSRKRRESVGNDKKMLQAKVNWRYLVG